MSLTRTSDSDQKTAVIEDIFNRVVKERSRGLIGEYKDFITDVLDLHPDVTYRQLVSVVNEKIKLDGKKGKNGDFLTISFLNLSRYMVRRNAKNKAQTRPTHTLIHPEVNTCLPPPEKVEIKNLDQSPVKNNSSTRALLVERPFKRSCALGATVNEPKRDALDVLLDETEKNFPGFIPGVGRLLS